MNTELCTTRFYSTRQSDYSAKQLHTAAPSWLTEVTRTTLSTVSNCLLNFDFKVRVLKVILPDREPFYLSDLYEIFLVTDMCHLGSNPQPNAW